MIGYACVGTNDFKRALAFYDALMGELGAKRAMDYETFVAWKQADGKPGFALVQPYNKKPATIGNGCMVAFEVKSPARNVVIVRLIGLPQIRCVRKRDRALLPHPMQRGARIQTTGKRDTDLLTDGKRLQNR